MMVNEETGNREGMKESVAMVLAMVNGAGPQQGATPKGTKLSTGTIGKDTPHPPECIHSNVDYREQGDGQWD